jgi:amidase
MPYFKQETLISSNEKKGLDDKNYIEALNKSHFGSKKILDDVIKENQLDAICGLTMGPACSIDNIYGDRWGDFSHNLQLQAAIRILQCFAKGL